MTLVVFIFYDHIVTRVNKPFDQLKCTDDGHVLMQWTPVGIQPNLYPTEDMNIKGNCVYNGEIIKVFLGYCHFN